MFDLLKQIDLRDKVEDRTSLTTNLIVIVGPTASGKTGLAIKLAQHYCGEVISADSRAIYKGMDIGTAKPTQEEKQGVEHFGIDIVGPGESFTVADFKKYAQEKIEQIRSRRHLPILVGGSGLYINAVLYDYNFGEVNMSLRNQLSELSIEELQQIIRERNIQMPENSLNKRYLMRAVEKGSSATSNNLFPKGVVILGLCPDKQELHKRIRERAEIMFASGVIEEAKNMTAQYGRDTEASKSIIYRVLRESLENSMSESETKELFIRRDQQLAKKQLTWFKRDSNINWFKNADLAMDWFMNNVRVKLK